MLVRMIARENAKSTARTEGPAITRSLLVKAGEIDEDVRVEMDSALLAGGSVTEDTPVLDEADSRPSLSHGTMVFSSFRFCFDDA